MTPHTGPVPHAHRAVLPQWLALRSIPPLPAQARSALLWGDGSVPYIAVRTAAIAVGRGIPVAVIDGAMAFQVTPIAALAQARRVSPERFLRHIHIARAFTCHQLATLLCERLDPLLATRRVGLVILLGPCTTFFDENVPFKDAFLLFRRVLQKIAALHQHGPLLLMAQTLDRRRTRRLAFMRDLVRAVELGIRVHTVQGRRQVQLVKAPPSSPLSHCPSSMQDWRS
jgi:hypothetical protein